MTNFSFADRYAEAGIAPTQSIIANRQATADRVVDAADNARMIDLAGTYYGSPGIELIWLRDEFAKEDTTFSLVNNEREVRVLATAILGALVAAGRSVAILAVIAGNVAGHRPPLGADWLLRDATEALLRLSVANRAPATIDTKVEPTINAKLTDQIAALTQDDPATLQVLLKAIRSEANGSAKTTASQTSTALAALDKQARMQREESQMLWWLVGGHSRSLERPFAALGAQQAALVAALDLAALTTVSSLGPVAAPALLQRAIVQARKGRGAPARDLAGAVDGLKSEELARLPLIADKVPARLAPVMTALGLARTIGAGAWHGRFQETTGLEASINFDPDQISTQLYREHLLAQLL